MKKLNLFGALAVAAVAIVACTGQAGRSRGLGDGHRQHGGHHCRGAGFRSRGGQRHLQEIRGCKDSYAVPLW